MWKQTTLLGLIVFALGFVGFLLNWMHDGTLMERPIAILVMMSGGIAAFLEFAALERKMLFEPLLLSLPTKEFRYGDVFLKSVTGWVVLVLFTFLGTLNMYLSADIGTLLANKSSYDMVKLGIIETIICIAGMMIIFLIHLSELLKKSLPESQQGYKLDI